MQNKRRNMAFKPVNQLIAAACFGIAIMLVTAGTVGGTAVPAELDTKVVEIKEENLMRQQVEPTELETVHAPGLRWLSHFVDVNQAMYPQIKGYDLVIDHQVVGHFKTATEAKSVVDSFLKVDEKEGRVIERVGFIESVAIEEAYQAPSTFVGFDTFEKATTYLRTGTLENKVYTVQSGDTLSGIAQAHGMSLDSLIASNQLNPNDPYLKIGDVLNVSEAKPLLTVKAVWVVTVDQTIKPEKVYESSNQYYKGETRLKQAGQTGEVQLTKRQYIENNKVVQEEIITEVVKTEMKPDVYVQGTKATPTKVASGNFSRPASGYIVYSRYGTRSSGFHTGIDLAMPTGSNVAASDAGTVIFSGSGGSYGYLIKIDHGKGVVSYYGHNSKLLVKKGDKVFKGQTIALSGNTGRSTGPHLHFEIRVNDVPVNPEKYLKF